MSIPQKNLKKSLSDGYTEGINEFGEKYQAVQILPELKSKYPTQLRSEILSVRIYQTDTTCYLEITEDKYPEKGKTDMGDSVINNVVTNDRTYITVRSVYFSVYETNAESKSFGSIFENAYSFIEEYDEQSKLNTTDLFSKEGAEEIFERIEAQRESEVDIYENRSGVRTYTRDQLIDKEYYFPVEDPDKVDTPFLTWYIDKGICSFNMRENHEYTDNYPFDALEYRPHSVEFISEKEEEYNLHCVKVPIELTNKIIIKSEVDFSEPYLKLGDYGFTIELTNGDIINMTAYLEENPPEYWLYIHRVTAVKGK